MRRFDVLIDRTYLEKGQKEVRRTRGPKTSWAASPLARLPLPSLPGCPSGSSLASLSIHQTSLRWNQEHLGALRCRSWGPISGLSGCVVGCLGLDQAVVGLFRPVLKLTLAALRGVLELSWGVLTHLWFLMYLSWACHWLSCAISAPVFELSWVCFVSFLGSSLGLSWPCLGSIF